MFRKGATAAAVLAFLTSPISALLGSSFGVPGDEATYDYVVVGGGTAGLTVASRLVQQNAGTVAVIEAGTFYELSNGNVSEVPATAAYFAGKSATDMQPQVDWGYMTTPQKNTNNQPIHYARAKALGGCSGRNFMVYQRGTVGTHERWADTVGDDSYNWDNFQPFYEKSVNFTHPKNDIRFANSTPEFDIAAVDDGIGPLAISYPNYAMPFSSWVVEALKKIGLPVIPGFLSGKLIGQTWSVFTLNGETMVRDSSATSFLREGMQYPELKVYLHHLAKKIIFDGKKATGVRVETMGMEYSLFARKEVILSAGVFNSPQLLMVSGVGPADTLKSLDIPVVADRPGVGQNMQDHLWSHVSYRVDIPTISMLKNPSMAAEQVQLFQDKLDGMYTSPVTDVVGWEKIPKSLREKWSNETQTALNDYPEDWPEVEYISTPTYMGNMSDFRYLGPDDGYNYAAMAFVLVAPRARGNVTITSSDTKDHPVINPNYFGEQSDLDIMIAAFKRIREVFDTEYLKNVTIGDEYMPGKDVVSDADIGNYLRNTYHTIWHAASTCTMGKKDDPKAVVDTESRVIGVEGLRVVDAAAFPFLVPGHLMSTIYAFAEKIACDISGNC